MRRKCALIMILVSLILLSSCAVHVYRYYIDKVPSWLIGNWVSDDGMTNLAITNNDINGFVIIDRVTVRDDLNRGAWVRDETITEHWYYLELGYDYGRTKSWRFDKVSGSDSIMLVYSGKGTPVKTTLTKI